ncbi:MAG: Mov34/MPN/PAD-1 family protein [Vogesella sp.]|uniref:CBASS system CD-NTase/cGAS isopeptidase Cap3 n=1 Tax=Vogesella sp. TaxID=1904252 RepID=UPI00391993FD
MINTELTFKDDSGGLLVIMPSAVNRLLDYRQIDSSSTEAAGVLIGERRGVHLVIHEISEPGKGDIRSRCFVDRRGEHHQAAIDEAFVRSSGKLQYLGEWHTHPEDRPSPSPKDLGTWRRHLVAQEQMALVIIGCCQIWAGKKIGNDIFPLLKI